MQYKFQVQAGGMSSIIYVHSIIFLKNRFKRLFRVHFGSSYSVLLENLSVPYFCSHSDVQVGS